jgi:transposase InsO family protein
MDFRSDPDRAHHWILQIKDNFSRFVWIYPLKTKDSGPIKYILIALFAEIEYPQIVQSDNGSEFLEEVMDFIEFLKIISIRGAPRHPQSQGSVEIANQIFKRVLRKVREEHNTREWVRFLPQIQLIMNTSQSNILPNHMTPYEVHFGRKPHFIRELLVEEFNPDTNEYQL